MRTPRAAAPGEPGASGLTVRFVGSSLDSGESGAALAAAGMVPFAYERGDGLLRLGEAARHLLGDETGADGAPLAHVDGDDVAALHRALDAARPGEPFEVELRVRIEPGRPHRLAVTGAAPPDGGAAVHGVLREVTRRREAEEALRDAERRFRELADAMPQIVWTARADGTIDYFNRRWFDFTGQPGETDGADPDWLAVVHPDDRARCLELWAASLSTGMPLEIEYRFREAETGIWRWHLGRAIPTRDPAGGVVRWYGTATDIDDRKQTEQRLATLQRVRQGLLGQKDVLFRELNHRVKNSLQLVSSLLQIQGRATPDPIMRRPIEDACGRVIAVARVHERLYRGDLADRLEFGPYLRDLCNELARSWGRPRGEGLLLAVEDLEIPTDQAVPLGLIANELVTNALKYAYPDGRPGPVTVTLCGGPGGEMDLAVADAGIGLPAGFDPKREMGMGMRLMSALLAQVGADLAIDRLDPGVRFRVHVPRRAGAPPQAAQA